MAALDRHDVDKAIDNALASAAAVTSLLGDPPRIGLYISPDVVFPFVRMDHIPIGPWFPKRGSTDSRVRDRTQRLPACRPERPPGGDRDR